MHKIHTFKFNQIDKITNRLQKGELFFIPTDTICGILSLKKESIYNLKKRPKSKNIISFISNKNYIKNLNYNQELFLNKFWPGATTIIKDGISYRIPKNKNLIKIIAKNTILFCSSANLSNSPHINNYLEASKVFDKDINYITDKYKGSNIPSTIIDIDTWEVLREGSNIKKINKFIIKMKI